jgi:uncharacterized protein YfdQ (DUF2303 family)
MGDVNLDKSALQEAVQIGQQTGKAVINEPVHYTIIPNNCTVYSLEKLQYPHGLPPSRITANVKLSDAASFCKYFDLYRDDRSRIFADPVTTSFQAVLDYHGAGERRPEFLSHKANLVMTKDERWRIWAGKSGTVFGQNEFAEFIEDHVSDIIEPSGADMLEIARDLKASIGGSFEARVVAKSGSVQMRYTETVDAKIGTGSVEVPDNFRIRIPVFYGEEPVEISVKLRFRISQGVLSFHYVLYGQAEILNRAFDTAVQSIADTLKCDVLLGSLG